MDIGNIEASESSLRDAELGHARRLHEVVIERAMLAGAERMHLEVRRSNEVALVLYSIYGFERIGLRKHYYRASFGNEDAVLLARRLDSRSRIGERRSRGPLVGAPPGARLGAL